MNKWVILIIGLILMVAIIFGVYSWSSTKEQLSVGCISWFDGCNTCSVVDGKIYACSKKYCEKYEEPRCLEYSLGCVKDLEDIYGSQVPSNGLIVVFKKELSELEINKFANENGLKIGHFWPTLNSSSFLITDGSNIYEKVCSLKKNNQLIAVDPDLPVFATSKPALENICGQEEKEVDIEKCGDFFSTYPSRFVQDGATNIYDSEGNYVYTCVGSGIYVSDEAKKEHDGKCAIYLANCSEVIKNC